MPRYRPPHPSEYSDAQRELARRWTVDRPAASRAVFPLATDDGELLGPPSIWIASPAIGSALASLGAQMRWGIALSERAREAAILAVAYAHDSAFEIFAHERAGRSVGWTDADLAAIRAGGAPDDADEEVRSALDVARLLLAHRSLDAGAFAGAEAVLGVEHLMQLVALVTYYEMVAVQLAAFAVLPPAP
ncbi:hypothetical protein GCM10009846_28360 [Agrococcus versicolor]|uniref:Carboxymuconolactone decarboxylase-like domain-containing protein n=1 Tax=Agrococcus versicolor TaxID=501482 RepID=A0ABP5MSQ2_9MICO